MRSMKRRGDRLYFSGLDISATVSFTFQIGNEAGTEVIPFDDENKFKLDDNNQVDWLLVVRSGFGPRHNPADIRG